MIFVTSSLRRNAPSPDAVVSGMAKSALAEAALGSKGSHSGSVVAKGSFIVNVVARGGVSGGCQLAIGERILAGIAFI